MSTWRWEDLQVRDFCLGLGEVSALLERVWGRAHGGRSVCLELGEAGEEGSRRSGSICQEWEDLPVGPSLCFPLPEQPDPTCCPCTHSGSQSLCSQQGSRKGMGWDSSRKPFLITVHSSLSHARGPQDSQSMRLPLSPCFSSQVHPAYTAPAPATLGLAWPLGHLRARWLHQQFLL